MSTCESAEDTLHKGNLEFLDVNYKGALELYNLSIELDDTNPDAYLKRALCYEKLRRLADVVADTTKAISLDPMYIKAYRLKGEASYEKGDYQTALEAFEKCLALDTRDSIYPAWIEKCKGSRSSAPKATTSSSSSSSTTPSSTAHSTPSSSSSSSSSTSTSAPQPARAPAPQAPKAPRAPKVSAESASHKPEEPAPTPKPVPTHEPAQHVPPPQPQRYTWYQTDSFVVVTIFLKGVKPADTSIDFEPSNLSVSVTLSADNQFLLDLELAHDIDPSGSKFEIMSTKIEIKMKKAQPQKWSHIEKQEEVAPPPPKKEKKNWDKIAKKAEEEEDKDSGFNQLMKDMYAGASEEERRAMMKSFHESGGTVLSCDWKDVSKAHVDPKPPAGVTRYEKDYV